MRFDLKKPCKSCPFRRGEGAVRLTEGRVEEVWATTTHNGGSFQCHTTIDYSESEFGYDDEDDNIVISKGEPQHCVGSAIAGLNSGEGPNQLVRIAAMMRMVDLDALEKSSDEVFASKEEMLETAIWRGVSRKT